MGLASWAKMTSPGSKLTALACHRTKRVNKAEEQTYVIILSVIMLNIINLIAIGIISDSII
jgi:hypothetical protein